MIDPSDDGNLLFLRGSTQQGPVPRNYVCKICNIGGHWIKDCPVKPVKRSTGIPRSFIVSVDNPTVPGSFLTPYGRYAVHATDYAAYMEKNKQIDLPPKIPAPLICPLCNDLMVEAVLVPCCSTSYCDDCITKSLLDGKCTSCHEKGVIPTPNSFIRNAVNKFTTRTGYSNPRQPVQQQQQQQQQSILSVFANPKDTLPVVSNPVNFSPILNPIMPLNNEQTVGRRWSEPGQQQQQTVIHPMRTENFQPEREPLYPASIGHVKPTALDQLMDSDDEPMTSMEDLNYQPPSKQKQQKDDHPILVDEPPKKEEGPPVKTPVIFPTPPSSLASLASTAPTSTLTEPAAPKAIAVNDCEIITLESPDLKYVTMIEKEVRQLGLKVDVMVPKSVVKTSSLIANLRTRGTVFVLVVRPDNVRYNTVTLHILRGRPKPEEHRNMPLGRAYPMIQECYLLHLKEKVGPVPKDVKVILSYILQNRIITDDDYGLVISSLQKRRDMQASVDSRMDCQYTAVNTHDELQKRILKMICLPDDDLSMDLKG